MPVSTSKGVEKTQLISDQAIGLQGRAVYGGPFSTTVGRDYGDTIKVRGDYITTITQTGIDPAAIAQLAALANNQARPGGVTGDEAGEDDAAATETLDDLRGDIQSGLQKLRDWVSQNKFLAVAVAVAVIFAWRKFRK